MISEQWQPIKDYEGLYEVSTFGNVRSLGNAKFKKTKQLKTVAQTNGYLSVTLSKNGIRNNYLIHRLVAEAFISNPDNKPNINHKNCNRHDNKVDNLEWCTQKENVAQTWKLGRGKVPNNKKLGVLTYGN